MSFSVGGNLFWGLRTDKGPTGFVWTWIDLLEHLAEVWPWLELEDGWPRGIAPQTPRDFDSAVRNLLVDLPTSRRVKEEQRLFEFRGHHDLSRALQGAIAPSLWVVREGHQMWLGSSTRDIKLSAAHVLETLEHLGDLIDQRIAQLDDERAREVHADWGSRCALGPQERLGIVTGMGREQIATLAGDAAMSWFEAEEGSLKPTEIMAAARMGGAITPTHVLRQIVDWIRSVPFCETPEIDRLSEHCPQGWPLHRSPAEEGYILATWLREVVGAGPEMCVDPEALLRKWGVEVKRNRLQFEVIDAVAAWGPSHGPAVLVNLDGRHAQSRHGQRATLAHEIVHLLVDRRGALPLADVVGGHVPEIVEKRARAFAAELLVPRLVVGEAFRNSTEPATTLLKLVQQFDASEELIAWQARNSEILLSEPVITFLRSKVSTPERF